MIRHRIEYRAPQSLEEALAILAGAGEECAVLGGGTWLIPNMTLAACQPKIVLDPKYLALSSITENDDEVCVGARATYEDMRHSSTILAHLPLLAKMSEGITGGVSIVGQGTIGGSACYANPSSDVPACLLALRARLQLRSMKGMREVNANHFYQGAFRTARLPEEILIGIVFPKERQTTASGYHKLKFSAGSWPVVTAAALAETHGDERVFRVALGAASAVPLLTEGRLKMPIQEGAFRAFALSCAIIDDEWSDELAGPGYRRNVAHSVVLKALLQCGVSM